MNDVYHTNEAQLMAKIIQVCDVKINSTQMAEIAQEMGMFSITISYLYTMLTSPETAHPRQSPTA
jgi:hypothetical protein